ncbi:hypothetical protein GDO81_007363 [Engystomops pustulosus]|uniref:Uncharacterized protein n=1 Tax=Engystomops pustulosus TaxID=76066 RepID=A0AAV7C7I4_ENGPU|nr:hypothetical protein GDO81_007363 [Engystomops pustulosus]
MSPVYVRDWHLVNRNDKYTGHIYKSIVFMSKVLPLSPSKFPVKSKNTAGKWLVGQHCPHEYTGLTNGVPNVV